MFESRGLKLAASASVKERRLAALLAGRDARDPALEAALVQAQVRGSLELAGLTGTEEEAAAAVALGRAVAAVEAGAPLTTDALLDWASAVTGSRRLRSAPREREGGPPPAPPEFVASRLAIL